MSSYLQTVAGFACLAAGLLCCALAISILLDDSVKATARDDASAFVVLAGLGCFAFAGAVHLL